MQSDLIYIIGTLAVITYVARATPFLGTGIVSRVPEEWLSSLDKLGVFLITAILAATLMPDPGMIRDPSYITPTIAGLATVVILYRLGKNVGLTLAASLLAFLIVRVVIGDGVAAPQPGP
jgi:branched-subunit amino acid transport protein